MEKHHARSHYRTLFAPTRRTLTAGGYASLYITRVGTTVTFMDALIRSRVILSVPLRGIAAYGNGPVFKLCWPSPRARPGKLDGTVTWIGSIELPPDGAL